MTTPCMHSASTADPGDSGVGRRTVLACAAVAVGGGLLAACGGSADEAKPKAASTADSPAGAAPLAKLADLAVGTAVAAKSDGKPVLLVRTSDTEVSGFSAVCPHQGCTVAPAGKTLKCPCHGSEFDSSGNRLKGPAPKGLSPFNVAVVDGSVVPA